MNVNDIRPEVYELARQAEEEIRPQFERVDRIAMLNTRKVMTAFQDNKVSDSCFAGTTGYGYDDLGREVLDKVYAQVFCTEAALVRIGFVNGTHALSAALLEYSSRAIHCFPSRGFRMIRSETLSALRAIATAH